MKLEGTWTALVTPFKPDMSVDWEGLAKNVEFQVAQGVTGVLPVGTTGESPTLGWAEHNEIVEKVITHCKGKCGILAGTGSNATAETIESTSHAVKAGAEAVLMVDCYYNGPSSQELRDEYYAAVASRFPDVGIVPYVIPGRSGTALAAEDLAILADRYNNISTVKEATGDLQRMARERELCGDDFSIMSGDDDITFKIMSDPNIRANGVISVMSNVIPGSVKRMVDLARGGDFAGAEKVRNAIEPLLGMVTVKVDNPRTLPSGSMVKVNDRYRNPVPVKTLMAALGMPSGPCRQPLGKMTKAGVGVVREVIRSVWENNPEVLQPIAEFYGIDIEQRINDDSVWESLTV